MAALLLRGRERGFVTYDEILKDFPTIEDDVMFLETLYEKFSTAGVDTVLERLCLVVLHPQRHLVVGFEDHRVGVLHLARNPGYKPDHRAKIPSGSKDAAGCPPGIP